MRRNFLERGVLALLLSVILLLSCSDRELSGGGAGSNGNGGDPVSVGIDKWRENKFGMFIHLGVYSVLGGDWSGTDINGTTKHFRSAGATAGADDEVVYGSGAGAEWILYDAMIPRQTYQTYKDGFTMANYNPKEIVDLAKRAGMKYIIITAKHHEGFCLYDSETTEWDVANTPAGELWGNDIIKPLADEARKAGLDFGLYFSHSKDWFHEGADGPIPELNRGYYSEAQREDYYQNYTYPMLKEIMSRYNPDILWWDTGQYNDNADRSLECNRIVRDANSNILCSNRLTSDNVSYGDFTTPEGDINNFEIPNRDFEVCFSTNATWGYSPYIDAYKSTSSIIERMLRANHFGGNTLLNIAIMPNGDISPKDRDILAQLSTFNSSNNECFSNTMKSPFTYNQPQGVVTHKIEGGREIIYYNILEWDQNGSLFLYGLMNSDDDIQSVTLLSERGNSLTYSSIDGVGLQIQNLPVNPPSGNCNSIKITFKSGITPIVEEGIRAINNKIELTPISGIINGGEYIFNSPYDVCYNFYTRAGNKIEWKVYVEEDAVYNLAIERGAWGVSNFNIYVNGSLALNASADATVGGTGGIEVSKLGKLSLTRGANTICILNSGGSWSCVRSVTLSR